MAVVLKCSVGYVLSHHTSLQTSLQRCFHLKTEIFNINTPYLMDSAAQKISAEMLNPTSVTQKPKKSKKQKRKLETQINSQNSTLDEEFIISSFQTLVKLGYEQNFFDSLPISASDWQENNQSARRLARKLDKGLFYLNLSDEFSKGSNEPKHHILCTKDAELNVRGLVESSCMDSMVLTFSGEKFIIPAKASFILGDVATAVGNLTHFKKKFDLILLDPPWANKSVKRKKQYWTMENDGIQKLSISNLANPGCLIAIWTTNNLEQNVFVKDTLFPTWSVKYCSTWHWIKVTQKGHLVTPFENVHKKPYENLILGRFQHASSENTVVEISKKVFVSIPSAIHSHKPPLQDILTPLLSIPNPACLELFARYLLPNWTSCGNEVLKLQHLDYYDIT